jgi:MerR family transcriptional regulator/heat shock protein HspR
MNLAGVERVFELEDELARMARRMAAIEAEAERLREQMESEIERVRRSFRAEIVPYRAPGDALIPVKGLKAFQIPIDHRRA